MRRGNRRRTMMRIARLACLAATIAASTICSTALAQVSNAFTYQGELGESGTPANGTFDFYFVLYDAPVGGSQVGITYCADNVAIAAGRFTVSIDMGSFTGLERYLEIWVRHDTGLGCGSGTGFTALSPRQRLAPTPNALYANTSRDSTFLGGQNAGFYTSASNLSAGILPNGRLSGVYASTVNLANSSNTLAGIGSGITSLNATNISSGTIADARLSPNVALQNASNVFSATNTFTQPVGFGGAPTFDVLRATSSTAIFTLHAIHGVGTSGYAVIGECTSAAASNSYGGYFTSQGTSGIGVYAQGLAQGAVGNYGAQLWASGNTGYGAYANALDAANANAVCYGVYGTNGSSNA